MTQTFLPLINTGETTLVVTDPVTLEESAIIIKSLPEIAASPINFNNNSPNVDIRLAGQLFESEYLNKIFYVGGDYTLPVTENVINWTSSYAVNSTNWPLSRLASSDNMMVGITISGQQRGPVYSYDGYSWFSSSMDSATFASSVCWSPTLNRFVAVGNRTTAWYSDDGLDWRIVTSSTRTTTLTFISGKDINACNWRSVIWDDNNSRFIAVGERDADYVTSGFSANTGSMMTSTDGINWNITQTVYTGSTGFRKVVNGNGILTAITANNIIRTSTNGGNTWTTSSFANTNRIYDVAYSPDLNKFYAPYDKNSYGSNETSSLFFYTSSNGIDWGTYQNELNNILVPSLAVPMYRIIWSSGSQAFVGIDNGTYTYLSDSSGHNFRHFAESKTAWGNFIQTPNNTIYDTLLTPSSGSDTSVIEPGYYNSYIQFELALDAGDPYNGVSTYYIGTSSLGMIIDSASLTAFNLPDSGSFTEDIEIDGIRYLREIDSPSEDTFYGYYESDNSENLFLLDSGSKSTFSASLKPAGRDYVVVSYGLWGVTNSSVAMILNLNTGTVEYQEDSTNRDVENSYYLTGGRLKFEVGPTLTSKGNGYWELAFKVGFDLFPRSYPSYLNRTDALILTTSTSTPPATASSPTVPAQTYVEQANAIITASRPEYWWRADSGLSTSAWNAVSGSINFELMNVTTANSTVGLYLSQSWGSSSALPSDLLAKHIFIRLDDVRPSTYELFGGPMQTGTILGSTGSSVVVEYYIYDDNGVYNDNKFKITNPSGSYFTYYLEGYSSGSKLIYTDFHQKSRPFAPAPYGYIDNWSPTSASGQSWPAGDSLNTYIVNYLYGLLWRSGSKMTIGRGRDTVVDSVPYPSYLHMYVKELAIYTSSLTIGEAHAFSQEMLARWP